MSVVTQMTTAECMGGPVKDKGVRGMNGKARRAVAPANAKKKMAFVKVCGKLSLKECRERLMRGPSGVNGEVLKEVRTSLKWIIKEKQSWEVCMSTISIY